MLIAASSTEELTCSNCAFMCSKLARIQYILDTEDDLYHVADLDEKIREVLNTTRAQFEHCQENETTTT